MTRTFMSHHKNTRLNISVNTGGNQPLKFIVRQLIVDRTVNITLLSFSVHVFIQTQPKPQVYHHNLNIADVMAYGKHFFVSLPLCFLTKWIKTGWHLVFSCVLSNVHFKLTCNRSANRLAVVANIVLCAQCTKPAALVIVALHMDFNCVFLPPG